MDENENDKQFLTLLCPTFCCNQDRYETKSQKIETHGLENFIFKAYSYHTGQDHAVLISTEYAFKNQEI